MSTQSVLDLILHTGTGTGVFLCWGTLVWTKDQRPTESRQWRGKTSMTKTKVGIFTEETELWKINWPQPHMIHKSPFTKQHDKTIVISSKQHLSDWTTCVYWYTRLYRAHFSCCNVNTWTRHLLAAGDGAAAEVSTGFGVDHGGNVFLCHEVGEKLLTALGFLPVEHKHTQVG